MDRIDSQVFLLGVRKNPTPPTHLNGAREILPSSQEIFDTKPLRMIKFGIKR